MLSVSPAGDDITEELVLSTLGHELGHAAFDAPGWIIDSKLEGHARDSASKTYRTWTRDARHLQAASGVAAGALGHAGEPGLEAERETWFAELRANEFMGSLLVPRERLSRAVVELAPEFGVRIEWGPTLFDDLTPNPPRFIAAEAFAYINMQRLQRGLAKRFGVHRRFIEVRMERYGLLP